jgi:hypothetical protein
VQLKICGSFEGGGGGQKKIFFFSNAFCPGLVPTRSHIQQETWVLSPGLMLMDCEDYRLPLSIFYVKHKWSYTFFLSYAFTHFIVQGQLHLHQEIQK